MPSKSGRRQSAERQAGWGWPLRTLFWSAIAFPICYALTGPYERVLAEVVKALVALTGRKLNITSLEAFAPADLGLFVSMCLASVQASRRTRLRAILLGVPLLAALEVAVLLGATWFILMHQHGVLADEFFRNFPHNLVKTIGWINPLLVWLAFLGSLELRLPAPRTGARVASEGSP